jgi:hypothetical protein
MSRPLTYLEEMERDRSTVVPSDRPERSSPRAWTDGRCLRCGFFDCEHRPDREDTTYVA